MTVHANRTAIPNERETERLSYQLDRIRIPFCWEFELFSEWNELCIRIGCGFFLLHVASNEHLWKVIKADVKVKVRIAAASYSKWLRVFVTLILFVQRLENWIMTIEHIIMYQFFAFGCDSNFIKSFDVRNVCSSFSEFGINLTRCQALKLKLVSRIRFFQRVNSFTEKKMPFHQLYRTISPQKLSVLIMTTK